ncbi:saccharopine dehydrogenase NADP-binding domain-containing protein [Mycobacterium sp. 141]|uniref:saccharopine dehydrogenase NADP-binding domain-containing protein n=1 Tax=Mycobacterium sp. 141 TaxID=1120797 RepID=UPI00056D479C|nr:saccharopine dehydrogenase NADP-binding domain-containing protein [Mycobacterium sp. 141]
MTRVLLLGSTGAVGRSCLDALAARADLVVTLGGRDEDRLRAVATASDSDVTALDISDEQAVAAALKQCDVLVNCAGPSSQHSARLATAASAAQVAYVDPGGDRALFDVLGEIGTDVPILLQTGVQPGLTGMLLRTLASVQPTAVTVWCGGLQDLTPASVLEYLASLRDPHSHPGAELRDGEIRTVRGREPEPPPAQFFPGSVSVHPHLDHETIEVAAEFDIEQVSWYNVFDGPRTRRAMQILAADHRTGHDVPEVSDVLAAAKLDLFGRNPYFAIAGVAEQDSCRTSLAVSCRDSFGVTGALTAFGVQCVLSSSPGVYPFWKLDVPREVWSFLDTEVPDVRVTSVDGTAIVPIHRLSALEEGVL